MIDALSDRNAYKEGEAALAFAQFDESAIRLAKK